MNFSTPTVLPINTVVVKCIHSVRYQAVSTHKYFCLPWNRIPNFNHFCLPPFTHRLSGLHKQKRIRRRPIEAFFFGGGRRGKSKSGMEYDNTTGKRRREKNIYRQPPTDLLPPPKIQDKSKNRLQAIVTSRLVPNSGNELNTRMWCVRFGPFSRFSTKIGDKTVQAAKAV